MFDSPQVKWDLISSIINFVYKMPHELSNNLRLRKLGNNRKISKSVEDRAKYPISFPEITLWP